MIDFETSQSWSLYWFVFLGGSKDEKAKSIISSMLYAEDKVVYDFITCKLVKHNLLISLDLRFFHLEFIRIFI